MPFQLERQKVFSRQGSVSIVRSFYRMGIICMTRQWDFRLWIRRRTMGSLPGRVRPPTPLSGLLKKPHKPPTPLPSPWVAAGGQARLRKERLCRRTRGVERSRRGENAIPPSLVGIDLRYAASPLLRMRQRGLFQQPGMRPLQTNPDRRGVFQRPLKRGITAPGV